MKTWKTLWALCLPAVLLLFLPTEAKAQYQFGYLSYNKALQNMPDYATAQSSLRTLKAKYDEEANYNEERFKKMFADYLQGQKSFPQQIMLKRQKELQVAMEQGISFRKDVERLLTKAEDELTQPIVHKLDSILALIGRENGFIFIVNTDNNNFPFIHAQAGKDITEVVIARIAGKVIPVNGVKTPNAVPQAEGTENNPSQETKAPDQPQPAQEQKVPTSK